MLDPLDFDLLTLCLTHTHTHVHTHSHSLSYLLMNMIVSKGQHQFKGKIMTDAMTVMDLKDGEIKMGRSPVNHAFKIHNVTKDKW